MKQTLAIALSAILLSGAAALAADASLTLDVLSAYVDKGQIINDEAVFQPSLEVAGPFGFGFGAWASINLTNNEDTDFPDSAGKISEVNLDLNWTLPWEGPLSLTLGGIYNIYPLDNAELDEDDEGNPVLSTSPADGEKMLYATLAAEDLWLSPTLTFQHGSRNSDDWIAVLGIGHSVELTDQLTLDLGAEVSYAGKYYVAADYGSDYGSTWGHAELNAALNYTVSETLSLGVNAAYSSILKSDVRRDIKDGEFYPDVDILYGGLTATCSF